MLKGLPVSQRAVVKVHLTLPSLCMFLDVCLGYLTTEVYIKVSGKRYPHIFIQQTLMLVWGSHSQKGK